MKLHYVQILKLCISKEQYKMLKSMFFFKYELLELFISSYNALNEYDKKFVTFWDFQKKPSLEKSKCLLGLHVGRSKFQCTSM